MQTKNIPALKIHKLSQEQYEAAVAADKIDPNALYLTPDNAMPPRGIRVWFSMAEAEAFAKTSEARGQIISVYTEETAKAYIVKDALGTLAELINLNDITVGGSY